MCLIFCFGVRKWFNIWDFFSTALVSPQISLNLTVFLFKPFLLHWSAVSVRPHAGFCAHHHCPPTDWQSSFQGCPLDIIASLSAILFASSSLAVPGVLCCKAVTILCLFAQKYSQASEPYLPFVFKAACSLMELIPCCACRQSTNLYAVVLDPPAPSLPTVALRRQPLTAAVCLTRVCWILRLSLAAFVLFRSHSWSFI